MNFKRLIRKKCIVFLMSQSTHKLANNKDNSSQTLEDQFRSLWWNLKPDRPMALERKYLKVSSTKTNLPRKLGWANGRPVALLNVRLVALYIAPFGRYQSANRLANWYPTGRLPVGVPIASCIWVFGTPTGWATGRPTNWYPTGRATSRGTSSFLHKGQWMNAWILN
jgi:hypothetical protein